MQCPDNDREERKINIMVLRNNVKVNPPSLIKKHVLRDTMVTNLYNTLIRKRYELVDLTSYFTREGTSLSFYLTRITMVLVCWPLPVHGFRER